MLDNFQWCVGSKAMGVWRGQEGDSGRERGRGRERKKKKIMCSKLESMKSKALTSKFKVFAWLSHEIHRKLIMTDSPSYKTLL
jgi:hypothetical protein